MRIKVTVDKLQSQGPKITVTDGDNNIILATQYLKDIPETDGALIFDSDDIIPLSFPSCGVCRREECDDTRGGKECRHWIWNYLMGRIKE